MRPRLERDERIVAWSVMPDTPAGQQVVVCTNRGVWLPGRERRLGWHEIHKATWSGSTLILVPAAHVGTGDGYDVVADQGAVEVALPEPDDVPLQVRDRVTRSVAYTEHHPVPGGGVRIVARRVPGVDGVAWQVRYDEGTDAADPNVIQATTDLVSVARTPAGGGDNLAGADDNQAGADDQAGGDNLAGGEEDDQAGGEEKAEAEEGEQEQGEPGPGR